MQKLKGANMDIDLCSQSGSISWEQDMCPWNKNDGTTDHRCAVKNVSICPYFRGIEALDTVFCDYKNK